MIARRLALLLALMWPVSLAPQVHADAPVIAAASDLQFALEDIAAAFTADTGLQVRLAFGSTGNFVTQIRQGAPFQMFMAADETFVLALARDGFTRDEGQLYGIGRLVLKVPDGAPLAADGTLASLRDALAAGRITRFAIANPDHAPYGQRAREALVHAGLWEAIQPVLVLGENVSQAAQFALSGNAEGGIIAYSLALSPQLAAKGSHALIPADWHAPLLQRMVLLNDAGPVAEAFYAYMSSPPARAIMERYGFALPKTP
jgi:molybdate transport system substrate-binding protein